MMPLLPRSLFGRLLASLVVAIGITLAIMVLLVVEDRRQFALQVGTTWDPSRRVAEITRELDVLHGETRIAALERIRADASAAAPRPRLRLQNFQPPNAAGDEKELNKQLQRQLGKTYHFEIRRVGPPRPAPGPGPEAGPGAADTLRGAAFSETAPDTAPGPGAASGEGLVIGSDSMVSGFASPAFIRLSPATTAGFVLSTSGPPPPTQAQFRDGVAMGPMMAGPMLYDVAVTLADGEQVVFRVDAPRQFPGLPNRLLMELGILIAVLAVVLYLTTRTITRPLSDLARAADASGRGVQVTPLTERGARELREATRAFNTMQERLRRYLDSRTRVLAAMSHDLRTPLTRLRLRVETVDDPALRARFGADLDEMEGLVAGALGLFSGVEGQESFTPVDVGALLQTLQAQFAEVGAQIALEGRTQSPLRAQPQALKRCLSNLIDNAIKFGTRARLSVSDGDEVTIRIRDDGPGIPPESLEQVFEPFFRIESSRNRSTGGTGLGLSIARDIAQAHGGTLVLANHPDGGLEATLRLPR